ncbi:class I SAM-dependent methyltransferase [Sphingomonas lenta]|uniref:Methyltransferase type 11 n=1 Tax=Sphingomonas lenta TaxID=1141887 RepID=A0A2A2SFR3_9SPHN|nr:class I SAM-dependent methyltransferase [Sphingomonas lenta]PAX08045.1 methyltransferase type 11 [Sphingomonas lenta]
MSDALDLCARGVISPQIALARLVLAGEPIDADAIERDAPDGSPLREVARLARAHRAKLDRLGQLAAAGLDPDGPDPLAATAALFDRLAGEEPEAAVAFYSLGDPALLRAATDELVEVVRSWVALDGAHVLDFGCGIGRVALALAPYVAEIVGVDISPAMVAQARERAAGLANARFEATDGGVLPFPDASFDLVLAVDSFPYLVRAGVLQPQLAKLSRVLRPGGDLVVFNWSYRGDEAADVAEAANAPGFTCLRSGERPFAIWDASGFHLRRSP